MAVQKGCFDLHSFFILQFHLSPVADRWTGGRYKGQYVVAVSTACWTYTNLVVVYPIWLLYIKQKHLNSSYRCPVDQRLTLEMYLNSCLELCEDWNLRGTYTSSGKTLIKNDKEIQNRFRVWKHREKYSICEVTTVNMSQCTPRRHTGNWTKKNHSFLISDLEVPWSPSQTGGERR
jgi:hypothetical protein